ncbi:hypothetical protein M8J76_009456 [Diaphorina citri]|nr:hypothetical protein M8J76_009456 [Diaphorina citri]
MSAHGQRIRIPIRVPSQRLPGQIIRIIPRRNIITLNRLHHPVRSGRIGIHRAPGAEQVQVVEILMDFQLAFGRIAVLADDALEPVVVDGGVEFGDVDGEEGRAEVTEDGRLVGVDGGGGRRGGRLCRKTEERRFLSLKLRVYHLS